MYHSDGGNMKNILFIFILCLCVNSGFSQVVLIANKGVEMNVTTNTAVADIYTLETQKSGNSIALVVFDLKVDPKDQFYTAIGKTGTELKKIWMKMQLSGDGKAPAALGSEDDMVNKIASTPGAIGYISESKVTDAVKTLYILK
jgi:ABC-type phosphate transport system substrate-binding protein